MSYERREYSPTLYSGVLFGIPGSVNVEGDKYLIGQQPANFLKENPIILGILFLILAYIIQKYA